MNNNIKRVNDSIYRFINNNKEEGSQEVFLSVAGFVPPEAHATANKIADYIKTNERFLKTGETLYFDYKGKLYSCHVAHHGRRQRIVRSVIPFFKFYKNHTKVDLEFAEASYWDRLFHASSPIHLKEYWSNLKFPKTHVPVNDPAADAFADGYTKIAAKAFQKYEPDFSSQDFPDYLSKADHNAFRVVQKGDKLKLIPKKLYRSNDLDKTMENYRKFLIREFGEAKVNFIAHLYRVDLADSQALTPEIIYRMNIGMASLEKQDLDAVVKKLKGNDMTLLSTRELRGIRRLCCKKDEVLTEKTFDAWLTGSYNKLSDIDKLKTAIKILSLTKEEITLHYTGREIADTITSTYAIAGMDYFKPYIDQQELQQIFTTLEKLFAVGDERQIQEGYDEILSHIITRKNIDKKDPEKGYRVGALIPAPPHPITKEPRWYVNTACVSNGKGIYYYILEPLDTTDLTLPIRKVYRNTTPQRCSREHKGSIGNDFNYINPPGYEGFNRSAKYDKELVDKTSIPLWVGYQHYASMQLANNNIKQVRASLRLAVHYYIQDKKSEQAIKPLHEIIHEHDADLIELARSLILESWFNIYSVCKLTLMMLRYKKPGVDYATQKKDAQYLYDIVQKRNGKFQDLKNDLFNTLHPNKKLLKQQENDNATFIALDKLMKQKKYGDIINVLDDLAMKANEHPSQKIKQEVIFTGHSLGAAVAEVAYVNATAKCRRIPMKQYSLKTHNPPAIRTDDNNLYKAYGKHVKLFKALNAKFSITHRIAAGDPVSQSGGKHPGSASDDKEEKDLLDWTQCETSVTRGLESSSHPDIRDTPITHSTLFGKAKPHSTYSAHLINSATAILNSKDATSEQKKKAMKIVQERMGDYQRIWVSPKVLSRFNEGDKRVWKEFQEAWDALGIRSNYVESIRSIIGIIFRIALARFAIMDEREDEQYDAGHGDWKKYRDHNGVFAVTQDGIISDKA